MRILEVIPIARSIKNDTLSYFSGSDVSVGSIIKVPLRKRIIPALVISSKDVGESKTEIKNSSFALKKISKTKCSHLLSKNFIETAETSANYYVGSIGSVLNSLVPKVLLENTEKIKLGTHKIEEHKKTTTSAAITSHTRYLYVIIELPLILHCGNAD